MKKTFAITCALLGGVTLLSGCHFFGGDDDDQPTPQKPGYVGSIYIEASDVNPSGITALQDGSLFLSAEGPIAKAAEKQGQFWFADVGAQQFTKQTINDPGSSNKYYSFDGHLVDTTSNPQRVFVCSNNVLGTTGPAVVVFEKQTNGSYAWKKAINLADVTAKKDQLCYRLFAQNGYLFALNPIPPKSGAGDYPVIHATPIKETAQLESDMKSVATYAELGIPSVTDLVFNDMTPVRDLGAGAWQLFLLNHKNSSVDLVKFMPDKASSAPQFESRTTMPFDSKIIPNAVTFANIDNSMFIIGTDDEKATPENIYKVAYAGGRMPIISFVGQTPVAVSAMAIGKDHFGGIKNDVLYAVLGAPLDNNYRVDEFTFY